MASRSALSVQDVDRFLKSLLVVSRTVEHLLETQAVKRATKLPLSSSKVHVLRLLGQRRSQTATQVARFLGVTKPAVTQLIDSMVRSKLVSRQTAKHDRREVGLMLTAGGRRQFLAVQQQQRHLLRNAARHTRGGKVDKWTTTLWEIGQAIAKADRSFELFCMQCGAYEDGTCVLTGGDAECLFLSYKTITNRKPAATSSEARPRSSKKSATVKRRPKRRTRR